MKINKEIMRDNILYVYSTDNICVLCRHNPKNKSLMIGNDGSCEICDSSITECFCFKEIYYEKNL